MEVGVACTAMYMMAGYVQKLPCPVVMLDRPLADVNASLAAKGVGPLEDWFVRKFDMVDAPRIPYESLFDTESAGALWEFLMPDEPFNADRHRMLSRMRVEDMDYGYDRQVLQEILERV